MSFMRGRCLRRELLHRPADLLEQLVRQLLAQPVEQGLEALGRLGRLEVVLLELTDLAGEIVGQEVELHVALGGGLPAPSRRLPLVARPGGQALGLARALSMA